MRQVALLLVILAVEASGQNLREQRQERFFTASCDAVWPHALDAFAAKGFDPEQMDREGGFIKFEFTRGTYTSNVNNRLRAWTYLQGSSIAYWLRVDGATLLLQDEPVGCDARVKINFTYYRKPFLLSASAVVASSNGWLEKGILDKITEANPVSRDQASRTADTGKLSDGRAPVEITSNPSRADIEVNGVFSGMTPATKRLKEGAYKIAVRKANYRPWEREIAVEPGDSLTLHAELQSVMTERTAPAEQPSTVEDEPPRKSGIKIIRN